MLEQEAVLIDKVGPAIVPEVDFSEVRQNNGLFPEGLIEHIRERGCVIVRNVVPKEQAVAWEAELKDYTREYKSVGGFPTDNPQNWSLWWTRPQVQIRSHPRVVQVMNAVNKLWHVADSTLPIDLDTQVVYPDRFRIRYPSKDQEYTLDAHLDSGSIERWEDTNYRQNYQKISDGEWEKYDAWCADHRLDADMNISGAEVNCSCWRSMQGWLSLSHCNTGDGTLRLLLSLKLSTAYYMLRPFFVDTEDFNDTDPTFPGAFPSNTQFFPTRDFHPHLDMDRSMIGIPPFRPGDYVFWHCDLIHEVDKFHPGKNDSSVVYYPCTPLTPYNLTSLLGVREAFLSASPPRDFRDLVIESESQHAGHGARKENILCEDGMRGMGFVKFDEDEAGLTEGQRCIRRQANEALGLN
ncbi:hypothetical protein BJX61DRAFT_492494 [Aspergillus egyptiacus]|nr:hypothetical protein BJX61DRAFT_492494 [Aspergillus egyptiacus]